VSNPNHMINMDGSYTYIDELCQSNIEYLPNFVIYVLVICSLEIALLDAKCIARVPWG